MAHIYRKTDKGHAEIETRAHKLTPRFRSALILVDGKRTDDDLRKLIPQEPEETLRQLTEQGFIELIATTATPKAHAAPAAAPAPERESERVMSASPSQLEQIKRESVRSLNNHLGPMAETLAMKIERARNMAELRPLLETASQIILNASGTGAAADFSSRFIEPYGG